jgi:hydrogenase-4 transcriptional activator
VNEGRFREDLYYRLNVFPIELPPLRTRPDDIPVLLQFFAEKYASRVGRRVDGVDPDTLAALTRYPWPGNVRELENLVERALVLNTSPLLKIPQEILAAYTPDGRAEAASAATGMHRTLTSAQSPINLDDTENTGLHHIQREHILRVLNATHWVIEGNHGAALKLGMKPATLRHRMKKLGIARAPLPRRRRRARPRARNWLVAKDHARSGAVDELERRQGIRIRDSDQGGLRAFVHIRAFSYRTRRPRDGDVSHTN